MNTSLILRAAHQSPFLISQIVQAGGQVELLATIEIAAYQEPTQIDHPLELVIFTSINAVDHGQRYLQEILEHNPEAEIVAIGPSTEKRLVELGHTVSFIPETRYNSEGLLAHAKLASVRDKRIVIISGIGGRELLLQTLQDRGAAVIKLASYQRVLPKIDIQPIAAKIDSGQIQQIICHSGEALQNLITLLAGGSCNVVFTLPLLVVSKRIEMIARDLGWSAPIIVADGATDRAIWDRLSKYFEEMSYE